MFGGLGCEVFGWRVLGFGEVEMDRTVTGLGFRVYGIELKDLEVYRGTSLIRNRTALGRQSRTMPRALWGS